MGFSEDEFNVLIEELDSEIHMADEDSVPDPLPQTVTLVGDIWLMGGHKLLCGDAIKSASFADLLLEMRPPTWRSPIHPATLPT